jgi:UPF0288 family protein (methanogenesis marker protein 3)
MKSQDLTFSITVDKTPDQVFTALKEVSSWWPGEIKGDTDRLGGVFTYRYKDLHRSIQKITEWVPGKRVAWHVTESYLSFIEDKEEWTGTDMVFEISAKGGKTELTFTHLGLTPKVECYGACSDGWGYIIKECLLDYITTGKRVSGVMESGKAA